MRRDFDEVFRVSFQSKISRNALVSAERRDRGEQLEGTDILALKHPAASQHVASLGRTGTVEAAADDIALFQDRNVAAKDVPVANEERRGRHRGDASANEIGLRSVFSPLHALRSWLFVGDPRHRGIPQTGTE